MTSSICNSFFSSFIFSIACKFLLYFASKSNFIASHDSKNKFNAWISALFISLKPYLRPPMFTVWVQFTLQSLYAVSSCCPVITIWINVFLSSFGISFYRVLTEISFRCKRESLWNSFAPVFQTLCETIALLVCLQTLLKNCKKYFDLFQMFHYFLLQLTFFFKVTLELYIYQR